MTRVNLRNANDPPPRSVLSIETASPGQHRGGPADWSGAVMSRAGGRTIIDAGRQPSSSGRPLDLRLAGRDHRVAKGHLYAPGNGSVAQRDRRATELSQAK